MAYQSDTENLLFPASPSPSDLNLSEHQTGNILEAANADDIHFQNTIPLEETEVIGSPLVEKQLEKPDFNTEMVDDLEKAVVLDSEAEEVHGTRELSDINKLSFHGSSRRTEKDTSLLSANADIAGSAAKNCSSGVKGSPVNDSESINQKRLVPELNANEQGCAKLNYVLSQEPEELSESTALDFVNQFLTSGNLDSSPAINIRNTVRLTSPPVSSAKGRYSLAKRIKPGSPIAQIGSFEWVDTDQKEGRGVGEHMSGAPFDFRSFRDRSSTKVTKYQKANHLNHKGGFNRANKPEDFVNKKSISGLTNLEAGASERETLEMADIGIDTQIAAEAMEALFYGPSHMEPASLEQTATSDSGGISKNAMRRKCTAKKCRRFSSSACKKSNNKNLYPEFAITTRSKSMTQVHAKKEGKNEGTMGTDTTTKPQKSQDNMISLRLDNHRPLGGEQLEVEPLGQQGSPSLTSTVVQTPQADLSGKRMNDATEGSILTYKRKRRYSFPNLPKEHRVAEKSPRLCLTAPEESRNGKMEQLEEQASVAFGLTSDAWKYPKRKRSNHEVRRHSIEAVSLSTPLVMNDVKKSSKCSQRSECKENHFHGSECTKTVSCDQCVSVASSKNVSNEYYTKSGKKILPKPSLVKEVIISEVPKSMLDFTCRNMRRQRNMADSRILLSQHLDDNTIKHQKRILARLGLLSASSSIDATHFIVDRFVRTRNMLEAIALGKPVVTPLWLNSCGEAGCLIDEKNYILRDVKKEKEIGFSLPLSLAQANQHPLLKGKTVFITPNIKPDKEMIISLIRIVHGQVLEHNEMPLGNNLRILDDLLVLSCEEDRAICEPLLSKGVAVYTSELLLNGIIVQKLDLLRHRLFVTHGKKNQSNRKSRTRNHPMDKRS
ncbi:uncharacterized protein [Rutidosis leptorrhynchoides]|uniref:uncharacterized protein n=1 Tax=Rutidosis leptorrhynchoides TaxID=125765 RepID=UPI003A9A1FFC